MKRLFSSFRPADVGSVAIMSGLLLLFVTMLVGLAVDYYRWSDARSHTQATLDAAVLAAARVLQTGGSDDEAIAVAEKFYAEAVKNRFTTTNDTVGFKVIDKGLAVKSFGTAFLPTYFMSVAGIKSLPLLVDNQIEQPSDQSDHSVARIGGGANAKSSIETSVMLDVSGSMSGQKLADLKAAASDLVKTVVWEDQSTAWSKIALVPFSADVRPPPEMLANIAAPGAVFNRNTLLGPRRYAPTQCVGERAGMKAFTDDPSAGANKLTLVHRRAGSSEVEAPCAIHENAVVTPLTANRDELLSKIAGLEAQGGTAGHVGTAWTYYMLSPQWAGVLRGESHPSSYGRSDVKKIAILMSDGEYNYTYDPDRAPSTDSGGSGISGIGSITGKPSFEQAISICGNMRDDGIDVYTIGFQLGANKRAIDTLRQCASTPGMAYTADSGEELKNAFRDIGLRISRLYLSN